MVFSSLVTRSCSRLNSGAGLRGVQADELLHEVAEHQRPLAGLGVHAHDRVLGLVLGRGELLAAEDASCRRSLLASRSRGVVVVVGVHRPQVSTSALSGAGSAS